MKTVLRTGYLYFFLLIGNSIALSAISETNTNSPVVGTEQILLQYNHCLQELQTECVFFGTVMNENGEHYNYYFQLHREFNSFSSLAILIDAQTEKVLVYDQSKATIENPEINNWQVGNAFLQFNTITNDWVFGIKTKDKKGFNFKADMLENMKKPLHTFDLRVGMEFVINQTGHLNGHIFTEQQEQFVTGQKAWFRQIWLSKPQATLHPLVGVLCQFNDGNAFYALNLMEPDALQGALAGWRSPDGTAMTMSQFVSVKATKEKEGMWSIDIAAPAVKLLLQNLLTEYAEQQVIVGLTKDMRPGFCAISKDTIG